MTKYDEVLEYLENAELAAKNGQWATCIYHIQQLLKFLKGE